VSFDPTRPCPGGHNLSIVQEAALEYRHLIRDMPADERPRERLRMRGAESLSNAELMAILLRTGIAGENAVRVAERVIAKVGGMRGLSRASYGELAAEKGMGGAKACQVLAAIELGKRVVHASPEERRFVKTPEDIYALLFADMALLEQEHLKVVLLTTRNEVVCVKDVYKGNIGSVVVHVGDVFRDAVREACPAIVAVHNHPSGDPAPSAEDAALTRRIIEAGNILGIEVVDHIVIARKGFVSLRDRKMGFS
jgi:DNA repair protein RadC